ncbi:hypothetical protein [Roseibium sp. SCP14]|uniref:hypothetical protein n=1 Tax=Roseibium sp. SCP14 TaxID=3141375 RepID=UPI00333DA69B
MAEDVKESAADKVTQETDLDARQPGASNPDTKSTSSNNNPETDPPELEIPSTPEERSGFGEEFRQATGKITSMATSVFGSTSSPPNPENFIKDAKFNEDLETLRNLHTFLNKEAVPLPDGFRLGALNSLKAAGQNQMGRPPTQEEWVAVEDKTQALFAQLTDADRKSYLASQMPNFLPKLAVWLVIISIGSMILSVFMAEVTLLSKGLDGALMVLFFLLWLMSLGAIGAAAFIGFNAISVTSDITFDISDSRLIVQRIVLGALFALFFTLPFGFHEFLAFVKSLSAAALNKATVPTKSELAFTNQSLLLIMPFVLGYSTSLVILILNRLISSASTLFGAHEAPAKGKSRNKSV